MSQRHRSPLKPLAVTGPPRGFMSFLLCSAAGPGSVAGISANGRAFCCLGLRRLRRSFTPAHRQPPGSWWLSAPIPSWLPQSAPLRIACRTPKGWVALLHGTLKDASPGLSWQPLRASPKPLAPQRISGFSVTLATDSQQQAYRPGPSHQPGLMPAALPRSRRSAPCRCHRFAGQCCTSRTHANPVGWH